MAGAFWSVMTWVVGSGRSASPRPPPRNRPLWHVRNAPVQHQRSYLWIAHRFRPSLGNRNIFVRIAGNSGEAPRFPVVACSHDSVLAGRNEVPPHMTWVGKGLTPAQHDPRAINAPERGTQAGTQHITRHGPTRHIVQRRVSARQIYRSEEHTSALQS